MAFVKRVVPDEREIRSLHPTEVECSYMVAERDGKLFLQLNSYGSDHRQIPDKLSQTLQFDEESAKELWDVLGSTFRFR
jgi:hypothetical protein